VCWLLHSIYDKARDDYSYKVFCKNKEEFKRGLFNLGLQQLDIVKKLNTDTLDIKFVFTVSDETLELRPGDGVRLIKDLISHHRVIGDVCRLGCKQRLKKERWVKFWSTFYR
jgi:hypothetical protein